MKKPPENTRSEQLYLHINTLAGAFNLSDELLAERVDQDYIDQISYSERNWDGTEARKPSPLLYRQELDELVEQINALLGTPKLKA